MGTSRKTTANPLTAGARYLTADGAVSLGVHENRSVPAGNGVPVRTKQPQRSQALATTPNADLADWTRSLELRLAEQAKELTRLSRLKRFLSPQLVDVILSDDADQLLKSHRREIVVVFVDLRGFTAFAETAAPEDVTQVLSQYQQEVGRTALAHEGTLERFTGDGIMVFFNDPVPIPDPAQRAAQMALEMRTRLQALCSCCRRIGHELDFGIGIAQGYATIGAIGFEGRWDYAAIGTVTNLASRLCTEAEAGKIFVSQRVASAIEARVELEEEPDLVLKGFSRRVIAYTLVGHLE
jgi:adenylate cyclase